MITSAQIDLWRSEPSEHQNLEFKEAKTTYDSEKLFEYCVGIANEGGGHLILGIRDEPPRPVVGTKAFTNIVDITERIFNKVGFRVEVEQVSHVDGRVLVFTIPSRLKGTAYSLDGKYLMRSGASLTAMSNDRLRVIFSEGLPHWIEETSRADVDAQTIVALLDTQAFFELIKQPYPTRQQGVVDKLVSERLVDKTGKCYSIRRIGALLLAKKLEQFPDVVRKAPRVIVYNGTDKLSVRLDQIGSRGYAVGFQGLIDYVVAQLPQNEVIKEALRANVKLLPANVVRELVANALVHQDFNLTGMSPTIEIYTNRLEISNPGEPVVPIERFIDGYESRNERLADLMRRMSICEERSMGIDMVVKTAEISQLPAPYFGTTGSRTIACIYGPKPFDEMDRSDRIRACYQHCALKRVMSQTMTNTSLRQRFGLAAGKQVIVSQIITATIDAGLIKADETAGVSKRYAKYLPIWA